MKNNYVQLHFHTTKAFSNMQGLQTFGFTIHFLGKFLRKAKDGNKIARTVWDMERMEQDQRGKMILRGPTRGKGKIFALHGDGGHLVQSWDLQYSFLCYYLLECSVCGHCVSVCCHTSDQWHNQKICSSRIQDMAKNRAEWFREQEPGSTARDSWDDRKGKSLGRRELVVPRKKEQRSSKGLWRRKTGNHQSPWAMYLEEQGNKRKQ